MQSAPFFPRRRRSFVLAALVILLHWMVLGLFETRLDLPRHGVGENHSTLVAELLPVAPSAPPPEPAPLPLPPPAPPPPLPEIAPLPAELGTPTMTGATDAAPQAVPAEAVSTGEGIAAAHSPRPISTGAATG